MRKVLAIMAIIAATAGCQTNGKPDSVAIQATLALVEANVNAAWDTYQTLADDADPEKAEKFRQTWAALRSVILANLNFLTEYYGDRAAGELNLLRVRYNQMDAQYGLP